MRSEFLDGLPRWLTGVVGVSEAEESSPTLRRRFVLMQCRKLGIYPMLVFPRGVWMQENLRCAFRYAECRCRFWVATEL